MKIPTTWSDITIGQQIKFEELNKLNTGYTSINMIAAYTSSDVEEIKKLHINEITDILNKFQFVTSNQIPTTEVLHEFDYKGHTYYISPTLLKAEFQDFISIENLQLQYKDNLFLALPKIIAVLAKRKNESLTDFDLDIRSKEFHDLPITVAYSIYLFFCLIVNQSQVDFQKTLEEVNESVQTYKDYITTIIQRPGGSGLFTRLLKVTLQKYVLFLLKNWNSFYIGYNSNRPKMNWIQKFRKYIIRKWKRN